MGGWRWSAWLARPVWLAAWVVLGFALLVYVVYAQNLIAFPFDYDQGEGFELVDTILFSQFRWPYQDTNTFPFYSSNYPPLFHLMAAPLVWLFGEAYWYGRLLGFLGTLVTASAIAYAVWREERHRGIAVLSGLALLASNTVYHIGPLLRQHMTMVMFETLAVVLLAVAIPQRQGGRIALGLGLLIAAGYTKQLAAISAVAVLAWFFIRHPRRAMVWGLGFALVGGGIFLGLTWATEGAWWRQVIVANVNDFFPGQMVGLFVLWFQLHGFLLVPAALFVAYELYFDRLSLYSVWFVVATVLGGAGSGTWGAGDSYFATSIAAMCILSGIALARTLRGGWRPRPSVYGRLIGRWVRLDAGRWLPVAGIVVPLLYVGYGIATLKMPTEGPLFGAVAEVLRIEPNTRGDFYDAAGYDVVGYANIGHLTTAEDIAAGWRIVAAVREADGPVLSEEAGFSLLAGREVITNPTQLLNLWRADVRDRSQLWDGSALLDMIVKREFALIVLRAQFYPVPVLEAIGQHYEVASVERMNGFEYLLLRPRAATVMWDAGAVGVMIRVG